MMRFTKREENDLCKKIVERYKKETEKECFEIIVCEDSEPSVSDNKLGGIPYFPKGETYPTSKDGKPMTLLLQVNLKEIELEEFPKEGILEIFVDEDFGWPIEFKMFIFEDGKEQSENLPNVKVCDIFTESMKIELKKTTCHMPPADYRADDAMRHAAYCETGNIDFVGGALDDKIYDLLNLDIPKACLGGYADFTQDDPRYDEDNRDFCLFKLDSCLHKNVMIGDCGILTVTISPEDLKEGRIENAVVDWDCC